MEPIKQHFRITYKKGEALRYTATLNVHKIWERFFRRARIPLAYSKGFHPQPRINQAMPLPLGMLSDFELLDFWIETETRQDINSIEEKLTHIQQPGLAILSLKEFTTKQKSLQSMVQSVKYIADRFFPEKDDTKILTLDEFHTQEEIMRTRRNKEYDLKPRILSLTASDEDNLQYSMHLTALPGLSGRPDEVLLAMGHDPNHFRITRTEIILTK